MIELTTNLHIHTVYSDGSELHKQIAKTAHNAGIDVLIFTDHNVLVRGADGYFEENGRKLLMLIGEELHDPTRSPQKSHLLVVGHQKELAGYTHDPQILIDQANRAGAISFIAHPFESELPVFGEPDISWVDWKAEGYTGIELWNGFSELKEVIHNHLDGLFITSYPQIIPNSPPSQTLKKWDELLASGKQVVAIGGADAHSLKLKWGVLKRSILPYSFHFKSINTHILVAQPLSGDLINDRKMVLNAFRQGHCFIGNDLPTSTHGFTFTALGKDKTAIMGDIISLRDGITLQIRLPIRARCFLIKDGKRIKAWTKHEFITQFIAEPGIYRVESYLEYLGKWRGWIFSNPIYVTGEK